MPSASNRSEIGHLQGPLDGRLIRLEPLSEAHVDALVSLATAEPELFRWFPADLSVAAVHRQALAAALAAAGAGREVPFALISRAGGQVVGTTRFLELRLEHLRAEIGFTWLSRAAWGTGINVEAKLLLLERAFETARLRRVEFKTDARNERSRGALLALGAAFEGVLRKHMVVQEGGARDSAYFSVLDDEWPVVRSALRARLERHLA